MSILSNYETKSGKDWELPTLLYKTRKEIWEAVVVHKTKLYEVLKQLAINEGSKYPAWKYLNALRQYYDRYNMTSIVRKLIDEFGFVKFVKE